MSDEKAKQIYEQVNHTKDVIKKLRQSAQENNHLADQLAKTNSVLIRQLKAYEKAGSVLI